MWEGRPILDKSSTRRALLGVIFPGYAQALKILAFLAQTKVYLFWRQKKKGKRTGFPRDKLSLR
jgi:hypothetical protein